MISAIIIDDEIDCVKSLEQDLKKYCSEINVVASCVGAKSGIKAINKFKPDAIFLDVEMPVIDGFELLEMVSHIEFEVVFTTAYDHFALRALKMSAIDYLLKPIVPENLITAVDKLLTKNEQLGNQHQIQFLLQNLKDIENNKVNRIILPTLDGLNFVSLDDIKYCSSDGAYSNVHLINGSKIMISKSLRYLEQILCDFHFFRVHKSFIVNLKMIKKYSRIDGGILLMSDGAKLKVSRTKRDELLSLF